MQTKVKNNHITVKNSEGIYVNVDIVTGEVAPAILVDNKNWVIKKQNSMLLSESYRRLGYKKFYRVQECGNFLEFKRFKIDNSLKLHQANFCKVRLCPMCAWRRSLKIFGQVSRVMDYALLQKDYSFIFLTLTCKNVKGEDLSSQLDVMFKAFNSMTRRKAFKGAIYGYFRALEVTHNTNVNSYSYDTYHPHFHIVLVVDKKYFRSKDYIKQAEWVELWQQSMKVDYKPIVDIRSFKSSTKKATAKSVAEVAKYSVKDNDLIIKNKQGEVNKRFTDRTVATLDTALAHRRLTAFGGLLKEYHQLLNLDDAEDGNLINTDNDDDLRDDLNYVIERYNWNIGYSNYVKTDVREPERD